MTPRRLLLSIVLALSLMASVTAQDSKPVSVKFKKKLRMVGERVKIKTFTKLVMSTFSNADEGEAEAVYLRSLEYSTRNFEILARNPRQVTKLRTHFLKHSKTETRDEAKTTKSLIAGKTFVIEKKGEVITVKDRKDQDVTDEVKTFIIEKFSGDFYDFETPFFKAMKGGRATVGKDIEVDPIIAQEMFKDDDPDPAAFQVTSMTLTLKSVDDKGCARFRTKIIFASLTKEKETTRLLLSGTVDVDTKTCHLRQFDLKGSVKFLGESANTVDTSRGKVEFKNVVTTLPKKAAK